VIALKTELVSDVEDESGLEKGLVCVECGHRITHDRFRIEVGGSHESIRLNLAGVLFRVGCFERAPGCRAVGESSTHWTWFPGYAWQVVVCGRCAEHLGWLYRDEDFVFYGLLLDALTRV
jgi:hypothetical protein